MAYCKISWYIAFLGSEKMAFYEYNRYNVWFIFVFTVVVFRCDCFGPGAWLGCTHRGLPQVFITVLRERWF